MFSKSISSFSLRSPLLVCVCLLALISCGESGNFKSNNSSGGVSDPSENPVVVLADVVGDLPKDLDITEGLLHYIQISVSKQEILNDLSISIDEISLDPVTGDELPANSVLFPVITSEDHDGVSPEIDSSGSNIHVYRNINGDGQDAHIKLRPQTDEFGETVLKVTLGYDSQEEIVYINVNVIETNKIPVISSVVYKCQPSEITCIQEEPILSGFAAAGYDPINNPLNMKEDWALSLVDFTSLGVNDLAGLRDENDATGDIEGITRIPANGEAFEVVMRIVDGNTSANQSKITFESKTPNLVRTQDIGLTKPLENVVDGSGNDVLLHYTGKELDDSGLPLTPTTVVQDFTVSIKPRLNKNSSSNVNDSGATDGLAEIHVHVDDGQYKRTSVFYIDVEAVNDAPVLAPIKDKTMKEDAELAVSVSITDVDNDISNPLFQFVESAPGALVRDITANAARTAFTIQLAYDAYNTDGVTDAQFGYVDPNVLDPINAPLTQGQIGIRVQDPDGETSLQEVFNLTVKAVNDTPVVVSGSREIQGVVPDSTIKRSDKIADPAEFIGGVPSMSFDELVDVLPTDLAPAAQRTLTFDIFDIDSDLAAMHALNAVVTELEGSRNKNIFFQTPQITSVTSKGSGYYGVVVVFEPTDSNVNGISNYTVKVADDRSGSKQLMKIEVVAKNDTPIFAVPPLADSNVNERSSITVPLNLSDVETKRARFTLINTSLPAASALPGVNLPITEIRPVNSNGAVKVFTDTFPEAAGVSFLTADLQVWATDTGDGLDAPETVNATYSIIIHDVNDKPTVALAVNALTINEDAAAQTVMFTPRDTDPVESLSYRVLSSNTSIIPHPKEFFGAGGEISDTDGVVVNTESFDFTPVADKSGTVTLTIRIMDEHGAWTEDKLVVTVDEVNDRPTISMPADVLADPAKRTVVESSNINVDITAADNSVGGLVTETARGDLILEAAIFAPDGISVSAYESLITEIKPIGNNARVKISTGVFPNGSLANQIDFKIKLRVTDTGNGLSSDDVNCPADGSACSSEWTEFDFSVTNKNDKPLLAIDTVTSISAVNEDTGGHYIEFKTADIDPLDQLKYTVVSTNTGLIPHPQSALADVATVYRDINDPGITNIQVPYTLNADRSGKATLKVRVHDYDASGTTALGLWVEKTIVIDVAEVNDAPTIDPIANQSMDEGKVIVVPFSALDNSLTGLVTETARANLDVSAASTATPGAPLNNLITQFEVVNNNKALRITTSPFPHNSPASTATYTIQVTVADKGESNDGVTDVQSVNTSFDLTINDVNDKPTVTVPVDVFNLTEDGTDVTVNFTPDDPDFANTLEYRVFSSKAGLIAHPVPGFIPVADGAPTSFNFAMTADRSGDAVLTLRIRDQDGLFIDHRINVAVQEVNDTPTLAPIADQDVNEGKVLVVPITALDNSLTGSVTETAKANLDITNIVITSPAAPLDGLIDTIEAINSNGSLRITTNDFPVGAPASTATYTIEVTVADKGESNDGATNILTAVRTFDLTVHDVNEKPGFSVLPPVTMSLLEDAALQTVTFTPDDPDPGNTLEYRVLSSNNGLIADPVPTFIVLTDEVSESFNFTPVVDKSGTANLTIRLKDQGGLTFDHVIAVTVEEVNDAPRIDTALTAQIVNERANITIPLNLNDNSDSATVVETARKNLVVTASSTSVNGAAYSAVVADADIITVSGNSKLRISAAELPHGGTLNSVNFTIDVSFADLGASNDGVTDIRTTGSHTFNLQVDNVNDAPVINSVDATSLASLTEDEVEAESIATGIGFPVIIDVDDKDPNESLTYTITSNNQALIPNSSLPTNVAIAGGYPATVTYHVQPVLEASGIAKLTLTVDDGEKTTNSTFNVIVTEVNDQPTIDPFDLGSTAPEGTSAFVKINNWQDETVRSKLVLTDVQVAVNPADQGTATNAEILALLDPANVSLDGAKNNLILQLGSYPAGALPTGVNFTVDVIFSDLGENDLGINVLQTAVESFNFEVTDANTKPTFTNASVTDVTLDEDDGDTTGLTGFAVAQSFTVELVDPDPAEDLTVVVTSGNTNLFDDPVITGATPTYQPGDTLTFTYTPKLNAFGTSTIKIVVDDGELSSTLNIPVTVNAVNDVHALTVLPSSVPANLNIDEDGTFILPFTVDDIETTQAAFTYTISSTNHALVDPADLSFTGGKLALSIKPQADSNDVRDGTADIVLTVSDGDVVNDITDTFTLSVNSINDAPSFVGLPSVHNIEEDEQDAAKLSIPFSITDVDDDEAAMTMSVVSDDQAIITTASASIANLGAGNYALDFSLLDDNVNGNVKLTITVDDANSESGTNGVQQVVKSVLVKVAAVNDQPIFGLDANTLTMNEDETSTLGFTLSDVENPDISNLLVAAEVLGTNNIQLADASSFSIDFTGTNVVVTPNANQSGEATIKVSVSDGNLTALSETFSLTVTAVNDSPVIEEVLAISNTSSADQSEILEPNYQDYRLAASNKPQITLRVSDADALDGMADPATVYSALTMSVAGDFITSQAVTDIDGVADNDEFVAELTFNDDGHGLGEISFSVDDGTGLANSSSVATEDVNVALYKLIAARTLNATGLTSLQCADEFGVIVDCATVSGALDLQDAKVNIADNTMSFTSMNAGCYINDGNQALNWAANNLSIHSAVNSATMAYADLEAYVNAANAGAGTCGITTWRLPTQDELQGLVDFSAATSPLVDALFASTDANVWYWTGTRYKDANRWWQVDFSDGRNYRSNNAAYVRLVSDQ